MMLYNKYRPQSFEFLAGQAHIKKILTNQVEKNQVSQSYLFTGPAGTGKTTVARILAAMVNCSTGATATPPATDPNVIDIFSGKSASDVIEMDAASNRGIEEIKEIRKQAYFSCIKMRRKIFIIDECHQLTPQAWEALLKILEEPPSHVIFILCTTEDQKVPETVQTRCTCLEFRELVVADIQAYLKKISDLEGMTINDSALLMLARGGRGSMRRAMSNMEMARSAGSPVTAELVESVTGAASASSVRDFLKSIVSCKFVDGLAASSRSIGTGVSAEDYLSSIASYCRDLMLCGAKGYDMVEYGYSQQEVADIVEIQNSIKAIGNHRKIIDAWILTIDERAKLTVFRQSPQYQIDVTWVKMVHDLKDLAKS